MTVAMIHAGALGNVPEFFAGEIGWGKVDRIFEKQGISSQVSQHPELRVPWTALSAVVENCARAVGDPDIGLLLSRHTSLETYGTWGSYIRSAPNLRAAYHRASSTIIYHSPGDRMILTPVPGGERLTYSFAAFGHLGSDNSSYCAAGVHLSIASLYLGRPWRPKKLHLSIPPIRRVSKIEQAFQSEVCLGGHEIAFDIPDDILDTPRPSSWRALATLADVERMRRRSPPVTLEDAVTDLLHVQMIDGAPSLDRVCQALDMSRRTLQRRLDLEGVGYRSIERRIVIERAKELLREGLSVTDVSQQLHYSSTNHFTRAFRKEIGQPPSDYQRRLSPSLSG
jgi:AraC-like DNA-binding protein